MNRPLSVLAARTDYLKSVLDQIQAGQILTSVCNCLDASTELGDAVYFDSVSSTMKKALAAFDTEYDQDGGLVASARSYVAGFIIEKTTPISGVLWIGGLLTDSSIIEVITGTVWPKDLFWLSATDAGKVTNTKQVPTSLCLQGIGNSKLMMLERRVTWANHTHQVFSMTESWLVSPETEPAFEGMAIPAGAVYGYDIASDVQLHEIFQIIPEAVRVFADGQLLTGNEIAVTVDNIWWMLASPVPTEFVNFTVTVIIPFSFGEPIIRSAYTNTPDDLELQAVQGRLSVDQKPWISGSSAPAARAVSQISGRTKSFTPVVSQLAGAGGLVVTTDSEGRAVVSDERGLEVLVEPQIVNLNNAIEATDGIYTYYAFPATRTCTMIGRIALPRFDSTITVEAQLIAEVEGLQVGAFPDLFGEVIVLPAADGVTPVPMPVAWGSPLTLAGKAIAANNMDLLSTVEADWVPVTSEGLVYLRLTAAVSAVDLNIMRFGIKLKQVNP